MLKPAAAKQFGTQLRPSVGEHPWPERIKSTTLDRFNPGQEETVLTLIEPVVVEVSADTAWSGQSFRHALRFIRARPELEPADSRPPGNTNRESSCAQASPGERVGLVHAGIFGFCPSGTGVLCRAYAGRKRREGACRVETRCSGPGRAVQAGSGKPRLDRRRILEAGVDFVEEFGVGRLTMRRLGSELGFEAKSLYRGIKRDRPPCLTLDGPVSSSRAERGANGTDAKSEARPPPVAGENSEGRTCQRSNAQRCEQRQVPESTRGPISGHRSTPPMRPTAQHKYGMHAPRSCHGNDIAPGTGQSRGDALPLRREGPAALPQMVQPPTGTVTGLTWKNAGYRVPEPVVPCFVSVKLAGVLE